MIHENIGTIGHLMVIGSFVTAALATFSYFKATQSTDELAENDWKKTARTLFIIHLFLVIGVATSLFVIIYNH